MALFRMPIMASSDMDRASKAIDPPKRAEAIASELRFCPIIYSIALSTTAPAWLRWAGDSFGSSGMDGFLNRRVGGRVRQLATSTCGHTGRPEPTEPHDCRVRRQGRPAAR